MRGKIQKLLAANHLTKLPEGLSRGLDLGSLRAGGASWFLLVSEDSEATRRRGRWISNGVMEIYVPEVGSIQFLPKLVTIQHQHGAEIVRAMLEMLTTNLDCQRSAQTSPKSHEPPCCPLL